MTYIPPLEGVVSTVNSTTIPLSASASFTGASEDVRTFATITFNVLANTSGTLELQFSPDGTNYDIVQPFNVAGGIALSCTTAVKAAYYRVKYTNGSVAQSQFRLQSLLNTTKTQTGAFVAMKEVSKGNSSSTPLASSATFTGATEASLYSSILTSVKSSSNATLFFDYSLDGNTWHSSSFSGYRVEAGIPMVAKETIRGTYYRVRLVNGTVAQTTLNLVTLTGQFDDEFLTDYNQVVRGNTGLIPDEVNKIIVSCNFSLTTAYQDIWGASGEMTLPTGAESYEIVSSSVNDTAAGTGARTVYVETLDANGLVQSQVVTLNGTTAVALTGTHTFPRYMSVATSGSGRENAGSITLRVAGGGATRSIITAGEGVALDSHYKVPSNCEFHITNLDYHTGDAAKRVTMRSRVMLPGSNTWLSTSVLPFSQQSFTANFDEVSSRFQAGTIIKYSGKTSSGTGDAVAVILSGYERRIS